MKSDAGKAYFLAAQKAEDAEKWYPVEIGPDGAFRVEDVPAGAYILSIDIQPVDGPNRPIAAGTQDFTVPQMPTGQSDIPLQLPPVQLIMLKSVNVGDVAPEIAANTIDGKPLKLSDYRGKYVLLNFWATWCGPCVAEVPNFKAVYAAFGSDERFAMINLSLDGTADDAKKFADKNG